MKDKEDTRQGFEIRACFDFNTAERAVQKLS